MAAAGGFALSSAISQIELDGLKVVTRI